MHPSPAASCVVVDTPDTSASTCMHVILLLLPAKEEQMENKDAPGRGGPEGKKGKQEAREKKKRKEGRRRGEKRCFLRGFRDRRRDLQGECGLLCFAAASLSNFIGMKR